MPKKHHNFQANVAKQINLYVFYVNGINGVSRDMDLQKHRFAQILIEI